jgi:hypothetical protein
MSFPSVAPTEIYNLPPQAAPSITFAPTLDGSSSSNPAVHFRITALAFLFSISGVVFMLILVHQSVLFLLKKRWRKADISKWELDRQVEEERRLLEEIESGVRKPERGVQFNESDVNDKDARHLEPSWIRERDFSMQWEDLSLTETEGSPTPPGCWILHAVPSRWGDGSGSRGSGVAAVAEKEEKASPRVTAGGGGSRSTRVTKKHKRVCPNEENSEGRSPKALPPLVLPLQLGPQCAVPTPLFVQPIAKTQS